jgi:hypothetical protein
MYAGSSVLIRRAAAIVLAFIVCGCAVIGSGPSTPREAAVVTGIMSGRASVAGEMSYVLRTANGRVHLVSQVLRNPVKEGDSVELELASGGAARIRER